MSYWEKIFRGILGGAQSIAENPLPEIGPDYSLRGLKYRDAGDNWFEVYVIAKSDEEFEVHCENFRKAGMKIADGGHVLAIKAEVAEAVLAPAAAVTYAQVLRGVPK